MDRKRLEQILRQVRSGKLGVAEAAKQMRTEPLKDLGFATLDLERSARRGFPEVIYGPGKTTEQIVTLVSELRRAKQTVLVTRVDPDVHEAVRRVEPKALYNATARALYVQGPGRKAGRAGVVVITAGTADEPVGEEAALTAELMGNRVRRIFDVGVAGIHRLTAHRETLVGARVIVAVAGMDGVLPTVVAGLTGCPVVAVPTSTGYGAGADGHAALLTMLNSCAAGLTVVNIDNGFGAGYAASLINRPPSRSASEG